LKQLREILQKLKRGPNDLVGVEIRARDLCAVRMRRGKNGTAVAGADIVPWTGVSSSEPGGYEPEATLSLPAPVNSRYAALAVQHRSAIVKILSFPGRFDPDAEERIPESMGLDQPADYRVSYKLIAEGHGKSEAQVLAVALPEPVATGTAALLPAGIPAPFSIEVAGLTAATAFLHGPGASHTGDAVGVLHFGQDVSLLSLFESGSLALVRVIELGTERVLSRVEASLGLDRETAEGLLSDGSFDISQPVSEVMDPLLKQLIVSRDFVERRKDCHITCLYATGGLVASRDVIEEIRAALGIEVKTWNPFDHLTLLPDAVPPALAGRGWEFAAAAGACLGAFEET